MYKTSLLLESSVFINSLFLFFSGERNVVPEVQMMIPIAKGKTIGIKGSAAGDELLPRRR